MNISVEPDTRIADAEVSEDELVVRLLDGRRVAVPLAWFPRLLHASADQRANWQLSAGGHGLHWPDIDEDLSVDGLLRGASATRPTPRAAE